MPILALELKTIHVNAVSRGVIDTPWWDLFPAEQKDAMFKRFAGNTPAGRVGTSEDVAHAVAFLIDNGFVTGQTVLNKGGWCFSRS